MGCWQIRKSPFVATTLMSFWAMALVDTNAQDIDPATEGRDLFEEFCGACHGYDGVPLLPGAPAFSKGERLEQSDTVLLQSISQGKGDLMPAWQDILSEDERVAILRYVKSIAGSGS